MNYLSDRIKKALKIALAMTIAYGIALQSGWMNPYWAGFAVAMISLDTVGQSLNKSILRMAGTLIAALFAFIFLAWFIQERWLMLGVLTIYIGFCTYMLTGKKWSYFWFVCAFVCLIISVSSGGDSAETFRIAVARTEETAMGILVYSLISIFLWPQSSRAGLEETATKIVVRQAALYKRCRSLLTGHEDSGAATTTTTPDVLLLDQFTEILDAAITDSSEVGELHLQWHAFHRNSRDMLKSMEHLQLSCSELQMLNVQRIIPNLNEFISELESRFVQIEQMLAGNAPQQRPRTVVLTIEKNELIPLSTFEKTALAVSRNELNRLELLSRSVFDVIADIKGYGKQHILPQKGKPFLSRLFLDPERITATVRVLATLWVSYFLWIYLNPPGNSAFVQLCVTHAMVIALMPTVSATALFIPFVGGGIVSGILYVFLMPHLSGYLQLGTMIFIYTFSVFYIFGKPQQVLVRLGAWFGFLFLTSISNEQTYCFSSYANRCVEIVFSVLVIIACTYFAQSPRPEKTFLRLIRRFFKYSEFLLSRMDQDQKPGRKSGLKEKWKGLVWVLYRNALPELPDTIAAWAEKIDYKSFPNNSPEQVSALVTSLHELTLRITEVLDAEELSQADFLVNALSDDVRAWRVLIEKGLGLWTTGQETGRLAGTDVSDRLKKQFNRLETRSREIFALEERGGTHPLEYENYFRLLGSYRGLSESGQKYLQLADKIDWHHWQESRF